MPNQDLIDRLSKVKQIATEAQSYIEKMEEENKMLRGYLFRLAKQSEGIINTQPLTEEEKHLALEGDVILDYHNKIKFTLINKPKE